MDDNLLENILDEERFPYLGMSLDERNFCLEVLNNCKDICDSDQKVDGIGSCKIVELCFRKENGIINANGSLAIGNDKPEYRVIDADICMEKDSIIVDMAITRLLVEDDRKSYRVLDCFKLKNGVLKRTSQYNYDMKNIYSDIENSKMKGKLK